MRVFFQETQNLIDQMRKDISVLNEEQDRDGHEKSRCLPVLERLFRCAHIMKSSSASVGFNDLEKLTLSLEKTFKKALDGELVLTVELLPLLSESVETCQRILNKEQVIGFDGLLEQLKSIPA
jgi:two-component system chemotaxis sensor kinase CheA